jgi:PfaB family protein
VKTNIGHTEAASGMASLIKTALCVYHQYIPATPQWVSPKQMETLQDSPFYVPAESRLWFLPEQTTQRRAAMNSLGSDGSYAHLIFAEEPSRKSLRNSYFQQTPFYLLPLAGFNRADLLEQLDQLQPALAAAESLPQFAGQVFAEFQRKSEATYALAIAGHHKLELDREIERAKSGIEQAFAEKSDWKTPLGSYFTAHPQGKQGGVAFVYPGAFTSYVGLCSSLHRFFPRIVDALAIFSDSDRIRKLMDQASRRVYPRSLEKLRPRQLEKLETELHEDATTMLLFGTGVAVGLTSILREYFQVQPQAAFGYSLGELSMMYALNVFTSADAIAEHLYNSPLFQTRLSGPKQAVQEFWGLPPTAAEADFWGTYVLLSNPDHVRVQLEQEPRVYLTHINTPTEVVIAGDNSACQRVIQKLECDYFPAPSKHVLHCKAMRSELDELTDWFTLPTQAVPEIEFYSAATYGRTGQGSAKIAQSIATALCQPLDFPRLVNQVYADGARIFVELGPAGTCARWIGETLQDQDHTTVTLNTRGVDDHTATLRALAKLVSHRVALDLSPLYAPLATPTSPAKTLVNTLTLGRPPIHSTLLSAANRAKFTVRSLPMLSVAEQPQSGTVTPESVAQNPVSVQSSYPESVASPLHPVSRNEQSKQSSEAVANPSHPFTTVSLPFKVQPHATFLQMRQESLRKISQLMELQMVVAAQMNTTPSPTSNWTNQLGLPKTHPVPFRKRTDPGKGTSAPAGKQPHELTSGKKIGQSASPTPRRPPLLNEAAVLELAAGKLAPVWGSDYGVIDTYAKRVRLPMPPYLFINRVTRLEAERGCFQPCFIETEYDIPVDAWYAVNSQVPAAIFVEASQGNMILISYLGIDFETQGQRSFRALDGTITFMGAIPRAGETFRCQVRINSFTRGSGTLLYFYTCDYFVGDRKFLEVKAGAGFFTAQDLQKAPGVVLTKQEIAARSMVQKQQFMPLLSCPKTVFHQQDLLQLSTGNLTACFGVEYAPHQVRNPSLRLPLPAFRMIDRVVSVNPQGGILGLGVLIAEKDLHPEQWYFNCHFKDDYCMPGTVIGEGAAQLLQFYLLYLGLLARTTQARFHPILGLTQSSRSRGQVTPQHGTLIYEMEVVEVGLEPVPFAKAEVRVKLKDKTISLIKNLGIQLWEEPA